MNLYPWDDVIERAEMAIAQGGTVYQQWNCAACGVKQTMDSANSFHELGICEECKAVTDIKANGCNFMAVYGRIK